VAAREHGRPGTVRRVAHRHPGARQAAAQGEADRLVVVDEQHDAEEARRR
jgi:hypothetical protein